MDDRLIPFRHNAWATRVLLERCRPLSREDFHRRFPIGPGSLHDTLLHVIGAMRRWADRIGQRPLRPSPQGGETGLTPNEMIDLLAAAAAELEAVAVDVYANHRGEELIEFANPDGGPPWRFRKSASLAHVTTHGMHHRAQALNMLRQLGVDPLPEIDVMDWELAEGRPA